MTPSLFDDGGGAVDEAPAPPYPPPADPIFELEAPLWARGFRRVAGVDEAGRGPLAGPVVAGAAIFEPHFRIEGLDDSKRLTADQREALFDTICETAVAHGVGLATEAEIDRHNILGATHLAARRALAALAVAPDALVTDYLRLESTVPLVAEPRADQRAHAVAAASVLAKVTRDRLMVRYGAEYPEYGFDRHKGYSTPSHLRALDAVGPSTLHRRSFAAISWFDRPPRHSVSHGRLWVEIERAPALSDEVGERTAHVARLAAELEALAGFLPECELAALGAMLGRLREA